VRFASGACGVIEAATSVYPGFRRRIELTGTEGTAVLDGENITVWDLRDGSISPVARGPEVAGGASDPRAISAEGHRRVMADFAAAVAEGRPPLVDGRTGRESLEVVAMLYGSARGRATPPA
jgi:predicted dehydrogenase